MSPLDGVRLFVATPVDGAPSSAVASIGYQLTIARLLALHKDAGLLDPAIGCHPSDLVRARSLAVKAARDWGATHVLWLDADVVPAQGFLAAMIASGHDWVGCPYPKKKIHWDRVRPRPEEEPEALAYNYAYQTTGATQGIERVRVINGCIPVDRLAIGCTLTSMRALNAMWDFYESEEWFVDLADGKPIEAVALFALMYGQEQLVNGKRFRPLYSEDYSVCERYNRLRTVRPDLGFGSIHMLVSHPADHVGGAVFRGTAEGLIFAR
jgi:hypothetical protein